MMLKMTAKNGIQIRSLDTQTKSGDPGEKTGHLGENGFSYIMLYRGEHSLPVHDPPGRGTGHVMGRPPCLVMPS